VGGVFERLERAPKLDHIAIAVLPVVQDGEVVANDVDR
jgi:hypothetical protein